MLDKKHIPAGIRLLTWSTSVRWFGWGLGDAFIPIFLVLFSANFLETGLLASVYNIVFFLAIPFAGYLADHIKIKYMILAGLIIYVFIGLSYFLAGLTSMVLFIIIARGLNGVSYSLDQVGRESYFMRHSSKAHIAKIFGRFDLIAHFWWMVAVVIGLVLVTLWAVPIHWLLLSIVPTSIISFFIVLGLRERRKTNTKGIHLSQVYPNLFKDIKQSHAGLKIVLFISFVTGILSSIIYFFIPIAAFINGDGMVNAAVLALVYTIPTLLAKYLGSFADTKKEKIYIMTFSLLIAIFFTLIFVQQYIALLLIMFVSSSLFETISLTNRGMIARFADRTHLGEIDGSLNGISALGAIIGPISFGFLLDAYNPSVAYSVIIVISLMTLIVSIWGSKKYLRT